MEDKEQGRGDGYCLIIIIIIKKKFPHWSGLRVILKNDQRHKTIFFFWFQLLNLIFVFTSSVSCGFNTN